MHATWLSAYRALASPTKHLSTRFKTTFLALLSFLSVVHVFPIAFFPLHFEDIVTLRGIKLPKSSQMFTFSATLYSPASAPQPLTSPHPLLPPDGRISLQFQLLRPVAAWVMDGPLTILLEKNSRFLSSQFKYHAFQENTTTSHSDLVNKPCFYSGSIENMPGSLASLNLCHGVHGVVTFSSSLQFTVHSVPIARNPAHLTYLFVPSDSALHILDRPRSLHRRQAPPPAGPSPPKSPLTVYVTLANDPERVTRLGSHIVAATLDMFFHAHEVFRRGSDPPVLLVLRTLIDTHPNYLPATAADTHASFLAWWSGIWSRLGNGTDAGYLVTMSPAHTAATQSACFLNTTGVATAVLPGTLDTAAMAMQLAHAVGHTLGATHDPSGASTCRGVMQFPVPTSLTTLSTCARDAISGYLMQHDPSSLVRTHPDLGLSYFSIAYKAPASSTPAQSAQPAPRRPVPKTTARRPT